MSFEIHAGETAARNEAAATPRPPESPTAFAGFGKAVAYGIARGGARAANAAIMGIGTPLARMADAVAGTLDREPGEDAIPFSTKHQDALFGWIDSTDAPAYWTPRGEEFGVASNIFGGLAEMVLPLAAGGGNPALLLATPAIEEPRSLMREGADLATAAKVGAVQTGATALGFGIPALGPTLRSKILTGAGTNLAVGVGSRAVSRETLRSGGYDELSTRYDPESVEAALVDLGMGSIFGGIQHAAGTRVPRASRVGELPAELVDAVTLLNQAKHMQGAAPGRPTDAAGSTAHVDALQAAIDAVLRGEPVDVGGILADVRDRFLPPEEKTRRAAIDEQNAARLESIRESVRPMMEAAARDMDSFDLPIKAIAEAVGGTWKNPGVKGIERASEKVRDDYDGNASELKDIFRGTISVATPERGAAALQSIASRFEIVGTPRDWLNADPSAGNYRDIKVNISVNGRVGEVQINLPEMLEAKSKGHKFYGIVRTIDGDLTRYGRETVTPEEWALYERARDAQDALYAQAWEKAQARLASERKAASSMRTPFLSVDSKGKTRTVPSGRKALGAKPGDTSTGTPSTFQKSEPGGNADGSGGTGGSPFDDKVTRTIAGVEGVDVTVTTARGDKVAARYLVVEANDLLPSHLDDLRPNPDYPAELQPRDRTRATSAVQVAKIAEALDPAQLLDSRLASTGAPIAGPDGAIESGNARTLAIRRAYAMGKGDAYKAAIVAAADRLGVDPQAVAGMQYPILVRERISAVNRADFAADANESPTQLMSVTEQARADSRRLGSLDGLVTTERGEISIAESIDLIRRFVARVVGPNETNSLLTPDGRALSGPGMRRLRDAVFARAYEDPDVVYMAAESPDEQVRNVLGGMMRAAGDVAAMRDGISTANLYPLDFAADVAIAARKLAQIRNEGGKVDEFLAQGQIVPDPDFTPEAALLLQAFSENARSARRIGEILSTYTQTVEALGNPRQDSLLGGAIVPTKADILNDAIQRVRDRYADPPKAPELFDPKPADPVSEAADRAASFVEKYPAMRVVDDNGNTIDAQAAQRQARTDVERARAKAAAIEIVGRVFDRIGTDKVAAISEAYARQAEFNRTADEGAAVDPVKPGEPFLVFRLDAEPTLKGREAGNADDVARFLRDVEDPDLRSGTGGKQIHVFEVTTADEFVGFDEGGGVGRRAGDGNQVAYKFGEDGYTARHVTSITRAQLANAFGDRLQDVGTAAAAERIRDLANPQRVSDRRRNYAAFGQMALDFDAAPTAKDKTDALARMRGTPIAQKYAKTYKVGGVNQLVGERAATMDDLAVLAQIYRTPQYETMRYFFTKGDEIVAATAISSRMPSASKAFAAGKLADPAAIEQMMRDAGADGWYALHNHPTGNPKPSDADLRLTAHLAANSPGFRGHVVIDHSKFSTIAFRRVSLGLLADVQTKDLPSAGVDFFSQPSAIDHPVIGRKLLSDTDFAAIGRTLVDHRKEDSVVVIGRDAEGRVVGVDDVPLAMVRDDIKALADAHRRMVRWGSQQFFVIGNVPDEIIAKGVERGFLTDAQGWDVITGQSRPRYPFAFMTPETKSLADRGRMVSQELSRYDRQAASEIRRIVGRDLSAEEMDEIFSAIRGEARKIAETGTIAAKSQDPVNATILEAARRSAMEAVRQAELREFRTNLEIMKQGERMQDLARSAAGGRGGLDTISRMVAEHGDQGNIFSVEARFKGIVREARSQLVDAWKALGDDWFGFIQDPEKLQLLVREMKGEDTGNATAKRGAEAWKSVTDRLRDRMNAAGGDIGMLEDWGFPQHHSQRRVARAGKDDWVAFVMDRVDASRYRHLDGSPMPPEEIAEFLGGAWETIATDGANKIEPGQFVGAGPRANRHSAGREIHFRDAQSAIEYWQSFGDAPFASILSGHVEGMARDIAFIETFGPNPDKTYRLLRDHAYRREAAANPEDFEATKKRLQSLDNLYNYASGKTSTFSDGPLARTFDTIRNLNVAGKLGSAFWTSFFGDKATFELISHLNNVPITQRFYNEIRLLNPANKGERAQLQRIGLFLDAFSEAANRFGGDLVANTMSGRLANGVMRLTGMQAINDWRRGAFGLGMMDAIGREVASGRKFEDLGESDVHLLRAHGVDAATWEVWRRAQLADLGHGNDQVLTPQAIAALDLSALEDLGSNPARLKREAITKLLGSVEAETDLGVIVPGWKEKAWIEGGVERNTWKGEISRAFWQFKTFPLTQFQRHWEIATSLGSKGGTAGYVAAMVAMQTVLGGMILTVQDLLTGKDPRAIDNGRFWGAALLKGGALGIYGDFLYSQNTSFGSGPMEAIAGPTLGTVSDLVVQAQKNFLKASRGDETTIGSDALRIGKGFIPGANIWYTRAALDHLIFHNLQETLNPGYLARMRERSWADYGQQWYWEPGTAAPQRAPDFGAMLPQ